MAANLNTAYGRRQAHRARKRARRDQMIMGGLALGGQILGLAGGIRRSREQEAYSGRLMDILTQGGGAQAGAAAGVQPQQQPPVGRLGPGGPQFQTLPQAPAAAGPGAMQGPTRQDQLSALREGAAKYEHPGFFANLGRSFGIGEMPEGIPPSMAIQGLSALAQPVSEKDKAMTAHYRAQTKSLLNPKRPGTAAGQAATAKAARESANSQHVSSVGAAVAGEGMEYLAKTSADQYIAQKGIDTTGWSPAHHAAYKATYKTEQDGARGRMQEATTNVLDTALQQARTTNDPSVLASAISRIRIQTSQDGVADTDGQLSSYIDKNETLRKRIAGDVSKLEELRGTYREAAAETMNARRLVSTSALSILNASTRQNLDPEGIFLFKDILEGDDSDAAQEAKALLAEMVNQNTQFSPKQRSRFDELYRRMVRQDFDHKVNYWKNIRASESPEAKFPLGAQRQATDWAGVDDIIESIPKFDPATKDPGRQVLQHAAMLVKEGFLSRARLQDLRANIDPDMDDIEQILSYLQPLAQRLGPYG